MGECIFCRIAHGELSADVVYETDEIVAFRDIEPQAPIHVLLVPKQHIAHLLDASEQEAGILGRLQLAAAEVARRLDLAERGFRLVTNCLEGGGQLVGHLHLHLLGGRAMSWPPG